MDNEFSWFFIGHAPNEKHYDELKLAKSVRNDMVFCDSVDRMVIGGNNDGLIKQKGLSTGSVQNAQITKTVQKGIGRIGICHSPFPTPLHAMLVLFRVKVCLQSVHHRKKIYRLMEGATALFLY